ncbi:hypothetical protein PMAYCL1PPCAC_04840, partial [Pristionchus mayeri]
LTQAASQYYKPVYTPATRVRQLGPLKVADKPECQLACDCARQNSTNCSSFNPPIPRSNCMAYFYKDGKCALLGESAFGGCTVKNTEYVLIPDPCLNYNCSNHGKCAVFEGWNPYCQCEEGFQGENCE